MYLRTRRSLLAVRERGRFSARVKRPPVFFKLRRQLACAPPERRLLANTSFLQIGPGGGGGGGGMQGGGGTRQCVCAEPICALRVVCSGGKVFFKIHMKRLDL